MLQHPAGKRERDECTETVTEQLYNKVRSQPGFGAVKSLVLVQFLGVVGLTDHGFGTWRHTEKGKSGTYLYFNNFELNRPPNVDLSNKEAKTAMKKTL